MAWMRPGAVIGADPQDMALRQGRANEERPKLVGQIKRCRRECQLPEHKTDHELAGETSTAPEGGCASSAPKLAVGQVERRRSVFVMAHHAVAAEPRHRFVATKVSGQSPPRC